MQGDYGFSPTVSGPVSVGQNDPSHSLAKRPPLGVHRHISTFHASLFNPRGKNLECYSIWTGEVTSPQPLVALRQAWKGVTQASGASQVLTGHFSQQLWFFVVLSYS
jgi:hypothetical protein